MNSLILYTNYKKLRNTLLVIDETQAKNKLTKLVSPVFICIAFFHERKKFCKRNISGNFSL